MGTARLPTTVRVETVGSGEPVAAAVGAVHGDEPCGVRAIERLLAADREFERAARLVVANERALAAERRYVDADLNRSFPGDPDADAHERRLAHELLAAVEGLPTLGFHATVSTDRPFGTVADLTPTKRRVFRALPVAEVADFTGVVEGRSVNLPGFLNVEAGYQGSAAAADNAYACLVAFLRELDVLPGAPSPSEPTHYRVQRLVRKEPGVSYEFHAENFERVAAGEAYATADGEPMTAEAPFWPVLMSADGHETLLGYAAERVGPLGAEVPDEAGGADTRE